MKLSIIIPAYNAAPTVEKTVRSVCAAASRVSGGAEVLVVDDGSTDQTPDILERLATRFDLKVIHQKNTGAYQARLNALKMISSDYFGFVDADDLVSPQMFVKMLALAEREGLDVVQCGYDGDGVEVPATRGRLILDDRQSVMREYVMPRLVDVRESSFIWDKIYRNQFDFSSFDITDHVTNFDDLIFNAHFFLKVERMGFVNAPLYHHLAVPGSAVHTFNASKLKDFREAIRVRRILLPSYGAGELARMNRKWCVRNCWSCIKLVLKSRTIALIDRPIYILRLLASLRFL